MKRIIFFLILILIIGFVIRSYKISSSPAGFFCDEASTGLNAYKILTTGRDEFGAGFPIFFKSFGNYRPGLPFYFSVPFIAIFGLTEFATRLPAVVIGTLTIALIYLLTYLLFDSITGMFAAVFLAVSPWHIQFSRYGAENIYFPFGVTISLCFYLLAIKKKRIIYYLLSYISFGIFLYTYFPAFMVMPVIIFILTLVNWQRVRLTWQIHAIGLLVFLLAYYPFLSGITNHTSTARFYQVAQVAAGKTNSEIIVTSVRTYVDHFLPEFLFTKGDIGYHTHFITRFSVRGMGELYLLQAPLILIGLWLIFRQKKHRILVTSLLILYPVASTLAPFTDGGGPFATRSILGIIPFTILSAIGLNYLSKRFGKILLFLVFVLLILSFGNYLNLYFNEYPKYSNDYWGWQFGAHDIMQYFLSHKNEYDEMYLSGDFNAPQIFIPFYDPENLCAGRCFIGGVEKINRYKRQLFAVRSEVFAKLNSGAFTTRYILRYPSIKTPAFYLITPVSPFAYR
jgi:4-amino-4-deoxy-L-arabinose transferase-like glycosyltransferase